MGEYFECFKIWKNFFNKMEKVEIINTNIEKATILKLIFLYTQRKPKS